MAKKLYLGDGDLLDAVRRACVVRTIRLRLTNKRTWQKVVFTRPRHIAASQDLRKLSFNTVHGNQQADLRSRCSISADCAVFVQVIRRSLTADAPDRSRYSLGATTSATLVGAVDIGSLGQMVVGANTMDLKRLLQIEPPLQWSMPLPMPPKKLRG
jgi:hypothetical protein